MVFSPFPADFDAAAIALGLDPPSQHTPSPPGYRPPADSRDRRTGPTPAPDITKQQPPAAAADPATAALRRLVGSCEAFARAAREFEDFPAGYGEHLDHLQSSLHRFEVAAMPPDDEHVDDYNGRLRALASGAPVVAVTLDRVRAYLERATAPRGYEPGEWPRWSRHYRYASGHEAWALVRSIPLPSNDAIVVIPPPRDGELGPEGEAEARRIAARIALAEGRHELLVLTDITGPRFRT